MLSVFTPEFALLVHTYTEDVYLLPFGAVLALYLYLTGKKEGLILFLLSIVLTKTTVWLLKLIFAVARPEGALVSVSSYAFPSGHAAMSFACATVGYLLLRYYWSTSSGMRMSVGVCFYLVAMYVAYTRILIDVHTWDQVIAGAGVGIVIPLLIHVVRRQYMTRSLHN